MTASACSKQPPDSLRPEGVTPPSATIDSAWQQTERLLQRMQQSSAALRDAVMRLLDTPTPENHQNAKAAWYAAMEDLEQSALLRFVDSKSAPPFDRLSDTYQKLITWPVQAGFLDGFGQHPTSGIVYDLSVPLNEDELRQQHQRTATNEASLGLYAIGVMLFGTENKRLASDFEPISALTDQHKEAGYQSAAELPANRRRRLLELQVALLREDIQQLSQLLDADLADSAGAHFHALPTAQRHNVWQAAATAMLVEQLLSVGQHQNAVDPKTPTGTYLWNNQLLARRLTAQLTGWASLLGESPQPSESPTLHNQIEQAVLALQPFLNNDASDRHDQGWQAVYHALRELSKSLSDGGATTPN